MFKSKHMKWKQKFYTHKKKKKKRESEKKNASFSCIYEIQKREKNVFTQKKCIISQKNLKNIFLNLLGKDRKHLKN